MLATYANSPENIGTDILRIYLSNFICGQSHVGDYLSVGKLPAGLFVELRQIHYHHGSSLKSCR